MAIPLGSSIDPPVIAVPAVLVAVSIGVTLLSLLLATYAVAEGAEAPAGDSPKARMAEETDAAAAITERVATQRTEPVTVGIKVLPG